MLALTPHLPSSCLTCSLLLEINGELIKMQTHLGSTPLTALQHCGEGLFPWLAHAPLSAPALRLQKLNPEKRSALAEATTNASVAINTNFV